MSASKTCDHCSATEYESAAVDEWFRISYHGQGMDYCTAACATEGIEALRIEDVEASMAALEDDQ